MNIKLIGTGAIYTKYNSACTLIDNKIIVDMPNGTLKQLLKQGLDCKEIKTIVITHKHGDHTADIPFFLKHICAYYKENYKITIIGPLGIRKKIIELFNAYNFEDEQEFNRFNVDIIETLDNEMEINGYKINSYQVSHGEEKPALGYVINNKVGLTGDTGMCDGVKRIIQNSKILIADSSLLEGDKSHMGVNNLRDLYTEYGKEIVCTHLRDTTRQYLIEKPIKGIKVVEDFAEINIE